MAPPLATAWSNLDHGTSPSNITMILAQLRITEAGIATAEAYQIQTSLQLANLRNEMATLRHMLEAPSSSPAPQSTPAVKHPTVAALSKDPLFSKDPDVYPDPITVLCRGCKTPLSLHCGQYDHHLREK